MDKKELRAVISSAESLLHNVLDKTISSDVRSKNAGADWHNRHRLHVLLEATRSVIKKEPISHQNLILATELVSTIGILNKWAQSPFWQVIENSLVNEYNHLVLLLHIAEHLKQSGLYPKLIPVSDVRTPDLVFNTLDADYPVYIELYQPSRFVRHGSCDMNVCMKIIKRAVSKAMSQLGKEKVGIVAIGGFNISTYTIENLIKTGQHELGKRRMPSFAGIMIASIGADLSRTFEGFRSQSLITLQYLLNEHYFGPVNFLVNPQQKRKNLNKIIRLQLVDCDSTITHPVMHGTSPQVPPFFVGEGNVDFVCGCCRSTLAESAWIYSLHNVVVECPKCRSYNLFTAQESHLSQKVFLTRGNFYFSDHSNLRQGVTILAQEK